MAIIQCPGCGKNISDKAEACPHCGETFKTGILCEECGEIIPEGCNACPNCGCPIAEKNISELTTIPKNKKTTKAKAIGIIITIIAFLAAVLVAIFVFVIGKSNVKEIVLSESQIDLKLKGTYSISYIIEPVEASEDLTIEWSSSDESVAIVDNNGKITGVGGGTCVITATVGKKSAEIAVKVDSTPEEYIIVDGETIALEDFAKEIEDNEVKFRTKYKGKKVTIVARVKEIEGGTYHTNLNHTFVARVILNGGSFLNNFCVEAGSIAKASQFEVGDLVKVEGKLTTDLYGTSFFMYGPNTIVKISE